MFKKENICLTKTDCCLCEEKNDAKKIWSCTHLILAKPQDAQNYSDVLERTRVRIFWLMYTLPTPESACLAA